MANSTLAAIGQSVAATTRLNTYQLVSPSVSGLDATRHVDVGQGDCTGLLWRDSVILYVDYGGVYNHPDNPKNGGKSRRATAVKARLPVTPDIAIVLTHWDWDHYYSANYNLDARLQAKWLVPRQLIGPRALKFANSLRRIECWPEVIGTQQIDFPVGPHHWVRIEKCAASPTVPGQSEDRNLTGLALTVCNVGQPGMADTYAIFTGDAPFDRVPSIGTASGTCRALMAYHHGAHSHWRPATDLAIPAHLSRSQSLIYSAGGAPNPYNHPNRTNYLASGWDGVAIETSDLRAANKMYHDVSL